MLLTNSIIKSPPTLIIFGKISQDDRIMKNALIYHLS